MEQFHKRFASWILFAIALIIFASFIAFVLPNEAMESSAVTGSDRSPDGSYLYSSQDLYEMAAKYGEEGRAYYIRARFTFDLVWPVAYWFFLTTALALSFKRVAMPSRLVLLPTFAALFDLAENMAASLVMYRYPATTPFIDSLAPLFTFLKWNAIYASFALIPVGIIWTVVSRRKKA
ncbi:hypothetical protein FLK61_31525 [Paenalkalicoccus suaedae]|uniref:Uncharacterized protein n=1 Tax=Paenalkalicoccus suaedae TaxID=2592382 RepID=A0A859FD10_9BACI|nr:hypothetical protein [Paenalkalicoccus suaedae]QKS71243.1 hypothetical protein FLK61_31525 [Paenalkalicoccus suaedae]